MKGLLLIFCSSYLVIIQGFSQSQDTTLKDLDSTSIIEVTSLQDTFLIVSDSTYVKENVSVKDTISIVTDSAILDKEVGLNDNVMGDSASTSLNTEGHLHDTVFKASEEHVFEKHPHEIEDTTLTKEAQIFNDETTEISDSLSSDNQVIAGKEEKFPLDTTKPYGVHFIKEFEMSGGTYHYLIVDAQHKEKLIHIPRIRHKHDVFLYEDLIMKVEVENEKMNLYSIILSEQIIGSLDRFDKVYYVSAGDKVLRVDTKSGASHFFKDFEKLYFDPSIKEPLKGKKFKSIHALVNYYNAYDFNDEKGELEPTKYEKID